MNEIDIYLQTMFSLKNSKSDEKSEYIDFVKRGIEKAKEIVNNASTDQR